ncbi:MAG: hypothetical protein N2257_02995 [Thermodesulfovibrionales bacterium]|nr:hypothetical protein [Thermodesulfovibrionales bacterium]
MKRILILNHHLVEFAGSELVTLELAEYFNIKGFDTLVGSFIYDKPLKKIFEKKKVNVVNFFKNPLPFTTFDIVWAHHFPTYIKAIVEERIKIKKLVISSLSPFHPLETIPEPFMAVADLILVNSYENFQKITSYGNEYIEKIMIFPNSVPQIFFNFFNRNPKNELKKIAVVSNHPPLEVLLLKGAFSKQKIVVDFFGVKGQYKLITPEILINYDLIISIGKTVQYAMALGIPVYCYDHFGGPGYLTLENYELAERFNYSGRCCNRKLTVEEIKKEILEFYSSAVVYREFFYNLSISKYSLEKNINRVLQRLKIDNELEYKNLEHKNFYFLSQMNKAYMVEFAKSRKTNSIKKLINTIKSMKAFQCIQTKFKNILQADTL